ncbi:MAG: PEGA domain-containing protein [Thermoplasmata archaeon]|nr:PEGA domain-containing protein [Thermoplasmata archaeon]
MRLLTALVVTLLLLASAPAAATIVDPIGLTQAAFARGALPSGNATLDLRVTPATASVAVNGTTVALAANGSAELHLAPGTYGVAAAAPGHRTFVGNVTLRAGQIVYLTVPLPANPTTPATSSGPSSSLWLAIALTIAGAVAVVALLLYVRRSPAGRVGEDGTPSDPPVVTPDAARPDEGPE